MAKKRRKKSKGSAQSAAALRLNGLRAFQSNDYDQAIETWERIPASFRPMPVLAEAYFRRGIERFYASEAHQQTGWEDLRKATEIQPNDPCYEYHLGLASHHLGDLALAIQSYRSARQMTGQFANRAAYPLALALLQQGHNPEADPVWADLNSDEQTMLRTTGVFRRRPYQLPPEAPQLWHTLVALEEGDLLTAQAGLDEPAAAAQTEQGIRHYYRGVLSAQLEDWEAARREWLAAYSAGICSQRLRDNLAEIFHRAAEDFVMQGDYQTALAAAQEAGGHKADDNALNELLAQIHQHLGYQAALASQWDQAQKHWQAAVELDSSSFRLSYNLALIHERQENYLAAGETWREALRRRPRHANHPDAIADEQVARLWQRAAEAYRKAGQFDEANRVYQQAIKWSPENLDVRLAMANGLLLEGRVQAAQNELERILERDPEHVPALLRLGEVYFRSGAWWNKTGALRCWKRALELQPDNQLARQAMTEWYLDQAEINFSWDRFAEAIENYQKALEFQPNDARTFAYIAECFICIADLGQAEAYSKRAMEYAGKDFDVFDLILSGWIKMNNSEQAWETIRQLEMQDESIPGEFYLEQALKWREENNLEEANSWIARSIEKAEPDEPAFCWIGERLLDYDNDLARQYLEKAIAANQLPGQAHLMLARLEDKLGNAKESKKHLNEAARIARKTRDSELADKVELARMMADGPQAFLERMLEMGGPQMVDDFLNDFSNQFGEDEFYDF
ncbi:MAG: tetratricopeptide repeat protein [Anaerolineales bacterium]|nr:tetratricopeptide repeat protein [Anaerolineales bacterium]